MTGIICLLASLLLIPGATAMTPPTNCAKVVVAGDAHGSCAGIAVIGSSSGAFAVAGLGSAEGHTAVTGVGSARGGNAVVGSGCAEGWISAAVVDGCPRGAFLENDMGT